MSVRNHGNQGRYCHRSLGSKVKGPFHTQTILDTKVWRSTILDYNLSRHLFTRRDWVTEISLVQIRINVKFVTVVFVDTPFYDLISFILVFLCHITVNANTLPKNVDRMIYNSIGL